MNMISTGAFQNEMDASNKQPTIAEKFAAVWEKKNAKAARAGGVSLMALSLAACGSSDDDTTTTSTDTSSDTTTTTVTPTNQTFTLTTGMDLPTGGAGDDTFSAPLSSSIMTFDTLDTLDGGAGTDTLVISSNTTGTAMAASVANIENIIFAASAAGTLSLQGASGYEKVEIRSTTADNTVTNIVVGTDIAVTNVGNQTLTFTAATTGYTGTADSSTLTLNGVAHTDAGADSLVLMAGVETYNVVVAGASTVDTLNSGTATKLVISGAGNLTIYEGTDAQVVNVDASAMTGALAIESRGAAAPDATVAGVDVVDYTMTGGSGNDTLDMTLSVTADEILVDGGAGDDTIVIAATPVNAGAAIAGDIIKGGTGADILTADVDLVDTAAVTAALTGISGIEKLNLSGAMGGSDTVTMSNLSADFNSVRISSATSTALTLNMGAGAQTVGIKVATGLAAADTLTVDAAGSATTDSLTITNELTTGQFAAADADITVTDFETVTLDTGSYATPTVQTMGVLNVGAANALVLTGSNGLTIQNGDAVTAKTIDASGMSGAFNMGNTAAAAGLVTLTGGDGADTLRGDAASTISGGAGADTIVGGSGIDTLSGGSGNDTITSGAGNDTIDGGLGDDTLTLAGDITSADVIDGGEGTDTLSLTSAGVAVIDGYDVSTANTLNANLSNVEALSVSNQFNTGVDMDMGRLEGITSITLVDGISGDESFTGLAANSTVTAKADNNADTDILTLALASAAGTTDTLTYAMSGPGAADDFGVVAISGVETFNVSGNEATASATVRTYTLGLNITTSTYGTTANFSGAEAITVDTAIEAATINITTTGAFTMNATASNLAQTITATNAVANTLYGGGGADVITSGSGGDTILGGTGADTITGGSGADTITGGSASDTIILTETVAASDTVVLNHSERGAAIDTIKGFTTGTGGDLIQISIAAVESATTSGIFTTATNLEELNDGTDVGAAAATLEVITAAATVSDGTDIVVLRGATFGTADDVEDALETGGSFALTVDAAAANANNAFAVVYTNGTDAKVAIAHIVTETANDTDFEAGDLNVIDLATIEGVTAIGASTFVNANFEFIA